MSFSGQTWPCACYPRLTYRSFGSLGLDRCHVKLLELFDRKQLPPFPPKEPGSLSVLRSGYKTEICRAQNYISLASFACYWIEARALLRLPRQQERRASDAEGRRHQTSLFVSRAPQLRKFGLCGLTKNSCCLPCRTLCECAGRNTRSSRCFFCPWLSLVVVTLDTSSREELASLSFIFCSCSWLSLANCIYGPSFCSPRDFELGIPWPKQRANTGALRSGGCLPCSIPQSLRELGSQLSPAPALALRHSPALP